MATYSISLQIGGIRSDVLKEISESRYFTYHISYNLSGATRSHCPKYLVRGEVYAGIR